MTRTILTAILTVLALNLLAGPHVGTAMGEPRRDTSAAELMRRYNVVWTSPSKDVTGVMPIGNGDIAAGVYAIENGDLYLLLAKNDAFDARGDIYKTGRVRVALNPNPFQAARPFRQTLDLPTGSIRLEADGVTLRVWADANRPVYHVEIVAPHELEVTAATEFWPRLDGTRDVQLQRDRASCVTLPLATAASIRRI